MAAEWPCRKGDSTLWWQMRLRQVKPKTRTETVSERFQRSSSRELLVGFLGFLDFVGNRVQLDSAKPEATLPNVSR